MDTSTTPAQDRSTSKLVQRHVVTLPVTCFASLLRLVAPWGGRSKVLPYMSWVDRFIGMFSLDLGIDLGTANTLVAVQGRGVVISEPSVVAVKKGTKQVMMDGNAVGEQAKIMLGKNPGHIEVVRPMKDGVIADFEICEKMLRYFIHRVHQRRFAKPRMVICVPSGITGVEQRAVQEAAEY
ncbi:MAG TPA: rod shape-determining protein, partial [Rhizobacter sp.]|nr:rod shape-determining protein [Rhizobacter sp.]